MVAQAELPSPSATPTPVDKRFGAIESFWAPQQAAELGVGWERILFYWNEIQPSDADDWNTLHVLEEWLVEASEHDRLVVGLLKNTPAWATDGPPFSGLPRGLYLPVDDPDNLWANYVRQIVEYYGPRGVHHWIIWNEPEIGAGVYGHEFDGSVEDYIRLLQVAYLVAKEHDPEAVIHLAGYSYWHDPDYLVEFMETLTSMPEAAENEYYFDVFSLHIYFRVETVFELVNFVDELQNSYGIDKPIWINETNAAPNLDPFWPVERPQFQVDLDQQAWYLVQAYGLGFAAGAESVAVYKLIDILLPEGGESFGILRPDFSQRPAYLAYRTTNRLLSGFSWPVDIQEHADYTIVSFHKGDLHGDELIRLLWARRDVALTLSVPANAESGQLIDYTGQSKSVHVQEGRYIISLDGARCRDQCDIGGPPLFLVETIDRDALPEMGDEVPVVRATLTATAEVSPTFTPWPTDTPTPSPTATQTPTATMTPTPTVTKTPTPSQTPTFSAAATDEPSTTPSVSGEPASSTAIPLSEPDLPPPVTAEQAPGSFVFLGAGVVALVVLMLLLRGRRSIN